MVLRASDHLTNAKTSQLSWRSRSEITPSPTPLFFSCLGDYSQNQSHFFFFFLHSQLLPGSSSSWNAVLTDKQTHGSFAAIAGVVLYAFPAIQQNIWGVSTKERSLHTTWDNVVMQTHFEIKKKPGLTRVPWQWASQGSQSGVYSTKLSSFVTSDLLILYHMIYNDGCPEFLAI